MKLKSGLAAVFLFFIQIIYLEDVFSSDIPTKRLALNFGVSNLASIPFFEAEIAYSLENYTISGSACTVALVSCMRQKTYFPIDDQKRFGIYVSPSLYFTFFGDPPKKTTTYEKLKSTLEPANMYLDVGIKYVLQKYSWSKITFGVDEVEFGVESNLYYYNEMYPKIKFYWNVI